MYRNERSRERKTRRIHQTKTHEEEKKKKERKRKEGKKEKEDEKKKAGDFPIGLARNDRFREDSRDSQR